MITRNLGGDRIGSGAKMNVKMHGYGRSTHNLSKVVRTTAAVGTLIPVLSTVGLPGDTWDLELNTIVKTLPTNGPLFGSMKVQLDVYETPIRLFQGRLMSNQLNVGADMSQVKLPYQELFATGKGSTKAYRPTEQVAANTIWSYLGLRGLGRQLISENTSQNIKRQVNAVPLLTYWEIFKYYYSNKQEDNAYVIHAAPAPMAVTSVEIATDGGTFSPLTTTAGTTQNIITGVSKIRVTMGYNPTAAQINTIFASLGLFNPAQQRYILASYMFNGGTITTNVITSNAAYNSWGGVNSYQLAVDNVPVQPTLTAFPLTNIDTMRNAILGYAGNVNAFNILNAGVHPYNYLQEGTTQGGRTVWNLSYPQEGLAVKTYQSDKNNNWIKTATITSITNTSKVDISAGYFSIDQLNLATKVYQLLNRVAVAGGTYNDYIETVYDINAVTQPYSPMYRGGLSKELLFEEVISTASTEGTLGTQPLGQLAGRGTMGNKHKGGQVVIHCKEHCYITAIFSITPRTDYSQGNSWDLDLTSFDNFHKPQLDEIGFQDLIAERLDWRSTEISGTSQAITKKAIGKQPAYIEYMTDINETYGEFAEPTQMWMTLNRQYEADDVTGSIKDATTYIDPKKYNNIYAENSLSAQNYWVQVGINARVRRIMSARLIPNL